MYNLDIIVINQHVHMFHCLIHNGMIKMYVLRIPGGLRLVHDAV